MKAIQEISGFFKGICLSTGTTPNKISSDDFLDGKDCIKAVEDIEQDCSNVYDDLEIEEYLDE